MRSVVIAVHRDHETIRHTGNYILTVDNGTLIIRDPVCRTCIVAIYAKGSYSHAVESLVKEGAEQHE